MRGLTQSLPQSSFLLELLMRSEFRDGDLKHSHIQPRENQNLQDRRIEVKWNCWKLEGLCEPWWASGVDTSNCFWTTLSLLKWLLCAFLFPMSPLSPLHIVCISSEQRQKVLHKGTNACCVNMLHDVFRTPRFMGGESNFPECCALWVICSGDLSTMGNLGEITVTFHIPFQCYLFGAVFLQFGYQYSQPLFSWQCPIILFWQVTPTSPPRIFLIFFPFRE